MAEYITKKIRDLNDFTQINPMTTGDHLVVASSEGTPSTNKATIKDVVGLYLESSSGQENGTTEQLQEIFIIAAVMSVSVLRVLTIHYM